MKKAALWILVILLCAVQGMAEGDPGLGESALSVRLERFEASSDMASMMLRFENRASQPVRVCLIEPCFNSSPALFSNGWSVDEITVGANGSDIIDVSILSDREDGQPVEVSLRFAANGVISSAMTVRCKGDGIEATEAAFDSAEREPQVMANRLIPGETRESERRILSDRLSAEDKARLEYGRAVICLRETEDGEDRFIRFCVLPVSVNDDGSVYADYSGYAVTVSAAPGFPLSTVEEVRDGQRLFRVSRIVLSGDAVFYAELAFEIDQAADGSLTLGEYSINSEELGGVYHNAPLSLFSGLNSANAVLSLDGQGSDVDARTVDDRFVSIPLEKPMEVEVKPSADLGEVYAYFEYYFKNNRSAVHPPFPI